MGAPWLFGIDGGGTSARLRIESIDGKSLFYAEGGPTNPRSNPSSAVRSSLTDLFNRAYAEARLSPADCVAGFVGTAGVDRSSDRGGFVSLLRSAAGFRSDDTSPPVEAGNDAEPALAGALADTEGILLIAGTGAIAFGRARDGTSVRAGGWGHLLGDEGSAFRIAFDAIARSLRSWEGRDLPTSLLDAALEFFDVKAPADILPIVYGGLDKTKIARFARIVGAQRDKGDALARDLFNVAARELCELVVSVHRRIAPRLERQRIAFRGGLVEGDAFLRADLESRLGSRIPSLRIVSPIADAATGACILARSLLPKT
jgi:glucosamine kinase